MSKPITPFKVATDPSATKLLHVWRTDLKAKRKAAVDIPKFVRSDRVRVLPRNPVHPAIVGEWYRP